MKRKRKEIKKPNKKIKLTKYEIQIKEYRTYYTKDRICSNCKNVFQEIHNIGQLKCGHHSCTYQYTEWTCCGSKTPKTYAEPCIKYDHFDKETEKDILTIPMNEDTIKIIESLEHVLKNGQFLVKDKILYCARSAKAKKLLKKKVSNKTIKGKKNKRNKNGKFNK